MEQYIVYYVPTVETPARKEDYNGQVYANGTPKEPGWLTVEELEQAYPEQEIQAPDKKEMISLFMTLIQARLDKFAQTRGYDNIASAISYASDSNPQYAIEGTYCQQIRSQTWTWCNRYMNDVIGELRPMPESWPAFEAELDAVIPLSWPNEDNR